VLSYLHCFCWEAPGSRPWLAAAGFCKLEVGRMVNGGGGDLIASGDSDVVPKKIGEK